jgi:hydrogenase-4 component F
MLLILVWLLPLLAGLGALSIRPDLARRIILIATASIHVAIVCIAWVQRPTSIAGGWLALDAPGLLVLSIISLLFLTVSIYIAGYLGREREARHIDLEEGLRFVNEAEYIFTSCLLFFLAAMSLVTVSQHFGLMWVAIEATTLASAPLIYFHRHHRSLESTWKYLLICSVGIALALVGNFLLAVALEGGSQRGSPSGLTLSQLLGNPQAIDKYWLQAAFLFFLVGYGTKVGLAPMHNWLPDAYSESPSAVAALLAGALELCAMLGLVRAHQVCLAAGAGGFSGGLLVVFGLISMGIAAVFILGQTDIKRLLAYSSVEHMGVVAIGVGLGGVGVFGASLHSIGHAFIKASLFLIAGNIVAAYGTKLAASIRDLSRSLPWSGTIWLAGAFAVVGFPPFSLFVSELTILKAALDQERWLVAALYLVFLAMIFIGSVNIVLPMAQRSSHGSEVRQQARREPPWAYIPPTLLILAVFVLGVYVPKPLSSLLTDVSAALGGR